MKTKTRKNAVAKRYRAFHIEPGLADYSAEGVGRVLIAKETLDEMNPTFVGMPVVNFEHTDLEPEELFDLSQEDKENIADGVVAATGYDEKSGWYYADMLIWDGETQSNIENGFSVSNAYQVDEENAAGGTWHGTPYEAEVKKAHYLHMAIVDNPRYEGARIFANSKRSNSAKEEIVKIKIFKNKESKPSLVDIAGKLEKKEKLTAEEKKIWNAAAVEEKPAEDPPKKDEVEEEEMENMSGVVKTEDGKEIPLEELVQMYKQKSSENAEDEYYSESDMIEIDGQEMSIADLMKAAGYGENQNAEAPTDEKAEEVVEGQRKNSKPAKPKPNEHFNTVKKVANKGAEVEKPNVNTKTSRLERGASRYGSTVKQGGK